MNAGFSRLERRMAAAGSDPDIGELQDRVLSLEERHRTMQLRIDVLERHVSDERANRSFR